MTGISQYTRSENPENNALRFVFLGMNGAFSRIPLDALIAHGYRPRAVVTPPPPGMPVSFRALETARLQAGEPGESIFASAFRAGIPVYEVGDLGDPRVPALLEDLDFLVTACFPRLLPQPWLNAPSRGSLNLHPSLLPAYRGPNPIEDQLAAGEKVTGITLHLMDATADTGPILLQEAFPIAAGTGVRALDREAAERGAQLLLRYLAAPGNYPPRPQMD